MKGGKETIKLKNPYTQVPPFTFLPFHTFLSHTSVCAINAVCIGIGIGTDEELPAVKPVFPNRAMSPPTTPPTSFKESVVVGVGVKYCTEAEDEVLSIVLLDELLLLLLELLSILLLPGDDGDPFRM